MYSERKDEESIFYEALELKSLAERSAYLKGVCGDDLDLLARVEALIKVHGNKQSILEAAASSLDMTLETESLTEGPGTKIGRYKLLELIGEGGFGVVYMAEQEEPIRRKVALKIIKLGMDTKQVIARFEAERQALALMEHPNIAKVLDAGATDTGRPYFVMELVRGIPLTKYCDKYTLATKQRLELFIEVCRAIQHAHQKGIIHRDIKPTNVMVTRHDGTGVPKVIDFGIAKATQQRLTETLRFPEYHQFICTPEYMSPEQAELSEADVDTRSDIYSLGVMLYELLTGSTPFERKELFSVSYDEIRRIICETDPPKPSTRLSSLGDELSEVAKLRQVHPGELCKIISGDLDWVVMKTLEKDRNRRYETANELAMDIERHLRDEPVVAGPPSTIYRLRKFIRRNRTGVLVGLVVIAALLIGLCLATVGFIQANREKERTKAALQRAGMNFQMARDAVDKMTEVAEKQLVNVPIMEKVRQDLLQQAQVFYQEFVEEEISNEPAVRQEMGRSYRRLGDIHQMLGQYEQAEEAYNSAMDVFNKLVVDFPDTADYRMEMVASENALGLTLRALGRHRQAERAFSTATELLEPLADEFPTEPAYAKALAEAHNNLGLILMDTGEPEKAKQAYRQALEIREELVVQFPDLPPVQARSGC